MEICQYCDELFLELLSLGHFSVIEYYFAYDGYQPGTLSWLFVDPSRLNCSFFDDCKTVIPTYLRIAISQLGSLLSTTMLCALLVLMKRSKTFWKSELRRLQVSFIGAKILFHLTFCLHYFLRKIACEIMAATMHGVMILSFLYSILLNLSVSKMMWRLKNDVASLAFENRMDEVSCAEIFGNIFAWSWAVCVPIVIFCYDSLADQTVFGIGKHSQCLTTTDKGNLYLIILPTCLTLFVNLMFTIFSTTTLYRMMASNPLIKVSVTSRLLRFLAKILTFQGLQWILGLVHYYDHHEIVGFFFELVGSLEGLVIFLVLAPGECKLR